MAVGCDVPAGRFSLPVVPPHITAPTVTVTTSAARTIRFMARERIPPGKTRVGDISTTT
jgi:hypothetical protein